MTPSPLPGRDPYRSALATLLAESGCTVRVWRKTNSGLAYYRDDDWGIEIPPPNGPVAFAVAAHEIGHQLLHRTGHAARWLEEVEAEEFALAQFDRFNLPGLEQARRRAAKHLVYAAAKAERRAPDERRRGSLAARIRARFPAWVYEMEVSR